MITRRRRWWWFAAGTVGLLFIIGLQTFSMSAAVDPTTLPVTSDLAKRLHAHVQFLASPELQGRKPGTPGNRKAADYIIGQFREIEVDTLPSLGGHRQKLAGELGDNLIGLKPATSPTAAAPWMLIGAHYDHLGGTYLGADDNASAVAILIETARTLPPLKHHHVLFAAFNAEEPPYIRTPLMGSQHFVDHLPKEISSSSRLQAVIVMDLMGGVHWQPLQDTIFAAGAELSPGLYRRVKDAARETLGVKREAQPLTPHASPLTVLPLGLHLIEEIPLMGRVSFSDYDAFRNVGVPFLFLSAGRTPRYHQPSDLPDTLHYERMASTVRWLQHVVHVIDRDKEPYRFDAGRMEVTDDVHSLRPLVTWAAEWGTRIPGTSPLSLARLKLDEKWLQRLDPGSATQEEIKRLERLSLRMQCLLADFPACFLL